MRNVILGEEPPLTFAERILMFAFMALVVLIPIAGVVVGFARAARPPCPEKTVVEVGACDFLGDCGVRFDDGTSGQLSYPTSGRRVQVCGSR